MIRSQLSYRLKRGEKTFSMTAPKKQAAVSSGLRLQFVLTAGVTLESSLEPLDLRVNCAWFLPAREALPCTRPAHFGALLRTHFAFFFRLRKEIWLALT